MLECFRYDIMTISTSPKEFRVPDIALRGVPDHLHGELKSAASRNHRSLNGEILARLAQSVTTETIDTEALLARIRLRSETLGSVDLSEGNLKSMRNNGRL